MGAVRQFFAICLIAVSIASLGVAGYSVFNIGKYASSFQKTVSVQQLFADCSNKLNKSKAAYKNKSFLSTSLSPNYIRNTEKCFQNTQDLLDTIEFAPTLLGSIVTTYNKKLTNFHTTLMRITTLRKGTKQLTKILIDEGHELAEISNLFKKELSQTKSKLVTETDPLRNYFFLGSSALFFLTLVIGAFIRFIKSMNVKRINSLAAKALINNNGQQNKVANDLISKVLIDNNMPNLQYLFSKKDEQDIKKEQVRLKFDKIEELANKELYNDQQVTKLQNEITALKKKLASDMLAEKNKEKAGEKKKQQAKQREQLTKEKELQAKRKEESVKKKELLAKQKEELAEQKIIKAKRKEHLVKQKVLQAKLKKQSVEKKEQQIKQREQQTKQKELQVKQREELAKKKETQIRTREQIAIQREEQVKSRELIAKKEALQTKEKIETAEKKAIQAKERIETAEKRVLQEKERVLAAKQQVILEKNRIKSVKQKVLQERNKIQSAKNEMLVEKQKVLQENKRVQNTLNLRKTKSAQTIDNRVENKPLDSTLRATDGPYRTELQQNLDEVITSLSKDFFSKSTVIDIDVESNLNVDIESKKLRQFLSALARQSIVKTNDIKSSKKLRISSKVVNSFLIIKFESKQMGAIQNTKEANTLNNFAFHYPKEIPFTQADQLVEHFNKSNYFKDIHNKQGNLIGTQAQVIFKLSNRKRIKTKTKVELQQTAP